MRGSLKQVIFEKVRAEIVSGHALPGSMYSVPTLAQSLGTSSTPVREALLELVNAGMLRAHKNRGFEVTLPSIKQGENIFALREVLEIHAAELAIDKIYKREKKLLSIAERFEKAVKIYDFEAYFDLDRQFHFEFVSAAGNEYLTETIFSLRDRARYFGILSPEGQSREIAAASEHYRIVELAVKGEIKELRQLMRHHVRSWEPIFVSAVNKLRRAKFTRIRAAKSG